MKTTILLTLWGLLWAMPTWVQALTVEEILLLKQNGVSEATIQLMLHSEMQARTREAATKEAMGIATITRPGGRPAIVYSTGSADQPVRDADERIKERHAWELLRHLIVDTRDRQQ